MKEVRCPYCAKFLFRMREGVVEVQIKCRCGRIVTVQGTEQDTKIAVTG